MSRFLFLPGPAHGHVNPTLEVAAELVARGNEVTYLLPAAFRDAVEATGATLVECDVTEPEPPPAGVDGGLQIARLFNHLMDAAEELAAPVLELHDRIRPDVVAGETMALWSSFLAAARPVATVAFSPTYVMAPQSPVMARMGERAAQMRGGPPIDVARLAAVGGRYGVEVSDPGAIMWGPASATVVFMPAEFHPGHETLGPSVHFVGPATARPEPVDGFDTARLEDGRGIYVSLGTVFNERKAFFASCLDAFGGGDRPVVLNHGKRLSAADFPAAPANVVLAPHVPQMRVLEHSAVFVTHCGMGSTMEAVAAGVPMVAVPQMPEQEVTAGQVAELGLGVRLDPADATPQALNDAVNTVLGDPTYRANVERMAASARAAGGGPAAADVLERVARQSSTGTRSSSSA